MSHAFAIRKCQHMQNKFHFENSVNQMGAFLLPSSYKLCSEFVESSRVELEELSRHVDEKATTGRWA